MRNMDLSACPQYFYLLAQLINLLAEYNQSPTSQLHLPHFFSSAIWLLPTHHHHSITSSSLSCFLGWRQEGKWRDLHFRGRVYSVQVSTWLEWRCKGRQYLLLNLRPKLASSTHHMTFSWEHPIFFFFFLFFLQGFSVLLMELNGPLK